ncbi:uncharacterized protein LOC129309184 [Prosopis cineraria]|uniref:uncharacterized protein LOC129309184 n=1 Tax=Prosopis cineraria TaxID=364024 RepID=UPI00240F6B7A|nr:uncharacterized protein LOC129309184 [Prosopis cineraria]
MGCGKSKHDVASGNTTVLKRKKSSVKRNKDQEIGAQTKDDNSSNVNDVNLNSRVEVQQDGDKIVNEVVGGKVDDVDSDGAMKSKTGNASVAEETVLQKNNDIVAGENVNVGEEKALEKSEEIVSGENAKEGEEKVVEKSEEVGVVVNEVESKTERADMEEEVKEEEKKNNRVDREEGLLPKEVSDGKFQGEEDDALKLYENDQKVNDAVVVEEKKTDDGKDDVSVKEGIMAMEEAPKDITNVPASEGEEKDLKAEEDQKENQSSNEDVKAN